MNSTKEQQSTVGNDTVNFVRFARLAEAGLDGHDYALDARLPHIPERWSSPDLREAWILDTSLNSEIVYHINLFLNATINQIGRTKIIRPAPIDASHRSVVVRVRHISFYNITDPCHS